MDKKSLEILLKILLIIVIAKIFFIYGIIRSYYIKKNKTEYKEEKDKKDDK